MPQTRFNPADTDFIMKMSEVGYSNVEIARRLGVTEGAIRYRLKRRAEGRSDGRKRKTSALAAFSGVIGVWIADYEGSRRRPTLWLLDRMLRAHHGYSRSYDALRRYVRKHFPEFHKKGARIRLETPPGTMMFVDWKEDIQVQIGAPGAWRKVQGLCFNLGFSRKMVVRYAFSKDLEAFLTQHQEAFRKLGGLPEVIRPDCLKSAVISWRGERSALNKRYRQYLEPLGVTAFPARPGTPEDKGKIEKRILDLYSRLDLKHRVYRDLGELEEHTDRILEESEKHWRCGATGLTVAESFDYEKRFLRPLPEHFPVLPIKETTTTVRNDATVFFDGNYYQVLGHLRNQTVLCWNTGHEVVIFHDGCEIERFAYLPHAKGMVRLSVQALQDPDLLISPTVRGWGLEVARRQVDIYQEMTR